MIRLKKAFMKHLASGENIVGAAVCARRCGPGKRRGVAACGHPHVRKNCRLRQCPRASPRPEKLPPAPLPALVVVARENAAGVAARAHPRDPLDYTKFGGKLQVKRKAGARFWQAGKRVIFVLADE
jgi:hypothetical protein